VAYIDGYPLFFLRSPAVANQSDGKNPIRFVKVQISHSKYITSGIVVAIGVSSYLNGKKLEFM
jgi:hypothetical protein